MDTKSKHMERQYPYSHTADMRVLVQSDYFSKTSKQHSELSMNISITRAHDTREAGTNANNFKAGMKSMLRSNTVNTLLYSKYLRALLEMGHCGLIRVGVWQFHRAVYR